MVITEYLKTASAKTTTLIKPLIKQLPIVLLNNVQTLIILTIKLKGLNKMKHKVPEFLLIITLLISLTSLVSNKAYAQQKLKKVVSTIGFEASGGVQSFQLSSNLASLNQLQIDQFGGAIGFGFSKDYWQAKIKPIGFYNSYTNSSTSIKLIESGAHFNLYPLKLLLGKTSRLPGLYLTGGIARAKYKINGSYLPEGQTSTCINDNETFSGNLLSWNIVGGAGIEYQIHQDHGFIGFFAEIKKGLSAGTSTNQNLFKNTTFNNFIMVNIGFAIGINQ